MFLRRLVLLLGLATVTSAVEYTDKGIAIVGTTESLNVAVTAGTSREDLISHEFASYISVHFAGFNLPAGDSVVISSPDENVTVSHTYTGQGRDQRGTFIASFVPGNSVTVTYKSNGTATAGQGYRITGYSRGYPSMKQESICGDGDQSLPAKCYAPGTNLSEGLPQAYEKSQAIARLLINGTYLCTGWLAGSEGHLFTNKHCFQQEDWALSTDIEFAAESSSCSEQCETQLGCPATLVATTSTFITDSEDIDYSVVKLPDCVDLSSYGYLQFRESGPVVNESIYVPQHPVGHAKRIVSTVDNGDPTTIRSVGEDGDCGTDQVGHDADTQGGSSGSPLIAAEDNLVVAIHHCGGCTNTAIDVRTVLTDLASKNITIKNLVASEDAGQNTPPLYAQTPCTSQSHKKSTHTRRNHTRPCSHSSNSTSNSTSTSAVATTATPLPTTVSSTRSPVATVAASKSSSSVVTKTTASSNTTSTTSTTVKKTAASNAAALTAASLVTQRATAPTSTPTTTAVTSSSSSSTTTSNSTHTTTSTSTSTTMKNSTSMKDCDSTPSPTSTSTSSTSEVDNDLLVGRLKAALTGSWYDDASPVSTPAATSPTPAPTPTSTPKATTHGPTPAPTWTWTHNATTSSPTPAPTWTSTTPAATSRLTSAPTATSTPKPTPCSHTPGPTVKSTSKPTTSSPTPAPIVPSTPRPTTRSSTSAPTPAPTVTSAPKPSTQTPTPKPTTVSSTPASTPKPTTPSPTPASTLTSTPKPTTSSPTRAPTATSTPKPSPTPASTHTSTSSPTPAPTVASSTPKPTPKATTPAPTPASTSLTSSSRGSEDVTQN